MKSAPVSASLLCPFGQRRTHPPGASLGHWRDHPGARLSFLTVWEVSAQLILNFPTVHQHPPASYPLPSSRDNHRNAGPQRPRPSRSPHDATQEAQRPHIVRQDTLEIVSALSAVCESPRLFRLRSTTVDTQTEKWTAAGDAVLQNGRGRECVAGAEDELSVRTSSRWRPCVTRPLSLFSPT